MCFMIVLTINQETSAIEWKVFEHTLIDGRTDAFGELEFTGAGQTSRAKVSLDLIPLTQGKYNYGGCFYFYTPYRSKMEDKLYTLGFGLDRD